MPDVDTSLDPLEQLISDVSGNSDALQNCFGPYFEWNLEPQGIPYIIVTPAGASNRYLMVGKEDTSRQVLSTQAKLFNVFSTDRTILVRDILPAISAAWEAQANMPMKGGQTCLQVLLTTPWSVIFVQARDSVLQRNIWQAAAHFEFIIQRPSGAL